MTSLSAPLHLTTFLLHLPLTLYLLAPLCSLVHTAQLPARLIARPNQNNDNYPTHISPSAGLVSVSSNFPYDDKRAIASRLLRKAASNKQNSLRDVLNHIHQTSPSTDSSTSTSSSRSASAFSSSDEKHKQLRHSSSESVRLVEKAANHFFSDEQNSTIQRQPISLHVDSSNPGAHQHSQKSKNEFQSMGREQKTSRPSMSEKQLLQQSVEALHTNSPSQATAALRTVEELCHSIHNGEALQQSGGFQPILNSLASRHRRVRATAAWAIATCCQNNRPVQKALLKAGAVPMLAKLAWRDVLNVRSRALFALNALVGMEEARLAFEKLPYATQVLLSSLNDNRDFRATRRALNLVELLVRKDLDGWKTQLEAWDVPLIVERLLREHSDIDVRESAARIIAALDGNMINV